ncbi:SDR family NAD(P)-dependent oxidoreductase [Streptomyces sp. NBC_00654]|nr:SDR family NAD(P)-dependent oxidoreductase [Streptomyces sp. NBC_00654]MCX4967357.1 SDR family NAD(P)-dependent oxidoreductase [Streptomyces sp. NBC_00654]
MPAESWRWTEQTWRGHVDAVRAGRRLVPGRWPGNARVAVALSFDSDHETIPLRDGETSPGRLAQGEYGARVGAARILDLLARHRAPATFFMPAVSALIHPEEARAYTYDGHELAVHGWIHERNMLLGRDDERELTARALDTGALLTLTDRDPEALDRAAARLGGDQAAHAADLADPDAPSSLIERAWAEQGPVDVLVNAAGVYPSLDMADVDAPAWDRLFAVNLRAPVLTTAAFARLAMAAGRPGTVVNISSGSALRSRPGGAPTRVPRPPWRWPPAPPPWNWANTASA